MLNTPKQLMFVIVFLVIYFAYMQNVYLIKVLIQNDI